MNWVNNAQPCEIRAAINGGFFDLETTKMIGEVGNGTIGNWIRGILTPKRCWCFGMTEKRTKYRVAMMKRIVVKEKKKRRVYYVVAEGIEKQYPYGLSNVGVLINKGQPMSWKESDWGSVSPETKTPRTAIGFSTNPCHIFFVVSKNATWNDVVEFFINELPTLVKQHPLGKNLNIKIQNAIMLDGGGSTQLAYRRVDKRGNVEIDKNAPKSDGRKIVNFIGAMIYCWDK